ncbi:MAG: FAD-linked oxidoreductase, partial [Caulobacter sp.]|nr:FAD-linked oxidoreductase [Vitreoscilla sp.]
MDRRHFIAAAGSATALQLVGCGGGGGSTPPAPPPVTGPDWASLSTGLQGNVLLPGTPAFSQAAPAFNALYDATVPRAVVHVAS